MAYVFDEFGEPLVVQSGFIQNSGNEDGIVPVPNALQQQHEQLQPFGFTGYQTDAAGELYFAQVRRYDAGPGRFVSEDKVKGFAGAPFTLNLYSYCWNKPTELVDLNGLYPVAGVTAEVGEDLNGQTHPGGPTAEQSGWWLLLDIIAFIPMIGALKYGDDVVAPVKKVEWKKIWRDIADSCSDDWRRMSNNLKELWENGSKNIMSFNASRNTKKSMECY